MTRFLPILLIVLFPIILQAQNVPACDSLSVNCCTFNINGNNTISLQASNYSTNIFPYPGFILFSENMDTVAMETVFYFGIGPNWQPHTLELKNEILLPFEGYIELHTGFFSSLACTFPITINDTNTVKIANHKPEYQINLFPNPSKGFVNIVFPNKASIITNTIKVFNQAGTEVYNQEISSNCAQIACTNWKTGIYHLIIIDPNGNMVAREKMILK